MIKNEQVHFEKDPLHQRCGWTFAKDSSFVAVASYCSDCHRGECSEPEMFNNQCDNQRKHLDEELLWVAEVSTKCLETCWDRKPSFPYGIVGNVFKDQIQATKVQIEFARDS